MSIASYKSTRQRKFFWALLACVLVSHTYLAIHDASLESHDDEICEVCFGHNSPNKPFGLVATPVGEFTPTQANFSLFANNTVVADEYYRGHAIRAPPGQAIIQ